MENKEKELINESIKVSDVLAKGYTACKVCNPY